LSGNLLRALAWFRSLHAKLFLVTAAVTSLLTVAVAFSISRNHHREMLDYSQRIALDTSQAVEIEVRQRWDVDRDLRDPRQIEDILQELAGPERSVLQIDVFRREGREEALSLVASSSPLGLVDFDLRLAAYLDVDGPRPELVALEDGTQAWRVHLPIRRPGGPAIGLVRTHIGLERWAAIDRANLAWTIRLLPPVLLGEFILLWLLLGSVIRGPLRRIQEAMRRLEQGDLEARAEVARQDELGQIARRFNQMASELKRISGEREGLISEIQGLNAHLQDRIDAALAELQAKNRELEALLDRIALLREELGQQERLAVAGQLTAAFAHEVGTPLNLVNSHLQLLQAQPDLSAKARERVQTIQAQIERVGEIVRKLLGHTRRPELHREVLPLADLLRDLQRLWTPTLAAHRVRFEVDLPADCRLEVDRKQMEQLFLNLVNNAVDAMPEGGRIHLAVEAEPGEAPRWRFALADTGTGIAPEHLPKVFKPMFTTKPEGKGTGLGLAIVREIVRAHGGDVRLDSTQGQGTTVRFTLPGA